MLAYNKAPTFGWLKSRGQFVSRDGSLILVALLFILPCVAAGPLFNSFRHREVRHASISRHSRQAADINSVIQTIQSVLDKDNSTGIAASELKDLAASVGATGRAILGSDASVTDADVNSVISTLIGSYNISYDDSKSSAVKKYGHKLQQYLYIWRSLSDRITLLQGSGQNYNLELAAVVKTSNDIQGALVQSVNSVSVLSSKFNKTRRAIRRKLYSRQDYGFYGGGFDYGGGLDYGGGFDFGGGADYGGGFDIGGGGDYGGGVSYNGGFDDTTGGDLGDTDSSYIPDYTANDSGDVIYDDGQNFDDGVDQTDDISDQTDVIDDQTDDFSDQTDDISDQTDDISDQTDDISDQTDDISDQTDDISDQTDVTDDQTDDISDQTDIDDQTDENSGLTDENGDETDDNSDQTDDNGDDTDVNGDETDDNADDTDENGDTTDGYSDSTGYGESTGFSDTIGSFGTTFSGPSETWSDVPSTPSGPTSTPGAGDNKSNSGKTGGNGGGKSGGGKNGGGKNGGGKMGGSGGRKPNPSGKKPPARWSAVKAYNYSSPNGASIAVNMSYQQGSWRLDGDIAYLQSKVR